MDATEIAGRVTIASRAYERIAAAAAADVLGVPRRSARAHVRDERGLVIAEITSGVASGGDPIVTRAEHARAAAQGRVAELTGAAVAEVRLRITHLVDTERRAS